MRKEGKYLPLLWGGVYGLALLLLSRLFVRHLGTLARLVGERLALDETAQLVQILEQFKEARIASPWPAVIVLGALGGWLLARLLRKCKRKVLCSCLVGVLLFLPLWSAVLGCTSINGIRPVTVLTGGRQPAEEPAETYSSQGDAWYIGFAQRTILPEEDSGQPLYIAGYNSGWEITGVLDYCQARAAWLDTGGEGLLLIGIDCVALDNGTVQVIREALADVPNCAGIHVYATHDHAGIDTLGLWGPVAVNGKNDAYMAALVEAAAEAGREAAASRKEGTLHFSQVETEGLSRDSRYPYVMDETLYQLTFSPADGSSGLRMIFYGAHAESLRGKNSQLSRDFPGMMCDWVKALTGDDAMFFPGAIGGLVMTKELYVAALDASWNMSLTAQALVDYVMAMEDAPQQTIAPDMAISRQQFVIPMDNPVFLLYKLLGIFGHSIIPGQSASGYAVQTELSVLRLDNMALALLPGEIFPELVTGEAYGDAGAAEENPTPLAELAVAYGVEQLLIVGLANDEVGYIVPPTDFLLNETMPYFERTMDRKGEDHYEETNSVGPLCAVRIAEAFELALQALDK